MNFASTNFRVAFLNAKTAPAIDRTHITKPDMMGAAVCMQGYAARVGLGITLTRYHSVEPIPRNIKLDFTQYFIAVWANAVNLFNVVFIIFVISGTGKYND
jgi:hypothetical protein